MDNTTYTITFYYKPTPIDYLKSRKFEAATEATLEAMREMERVDLIAVTSVEENTPDTLAFLQLTINGERVNMPEYNYRDDEAGLKAMRDMRETIASHDYCDCTLTSVELITRLDTIDLTPLFL